MKNLFLSAIVILGGCITSSMPAFSQQHPTDGIYVGIDGSYDQTKDSIKATPTNVYNADGPATGIFIGYRQSQGPVNVGVEARYGYSFVSNDVNTTIPTQGFDITHEFGADILPGFWLTDNINVFGRIGYTRATLVNSVQTVESKYSTGSLNLGAGVQIYPARNVSLRIEYVRSSFEGRPAQLYNSVLYTDWKIRRNRFRAAIITAF